VRWSERKLRITVQLINVADGYQLWSERYDREMADVFEIQDQIAHAIVDTLRVRLKGGQDTPIIKRGTADLEAYHLYLKGRHFQHAVALSKAVTCFEAAIARDPQFAQAHAGLADVYSLLGLYGYLRSSVALSKARAAADHAIALDESLAEAHEARGRAELYFGWDFAVMERELRRAIRLNPRQPSAYGWLGMGLALLGRFDEVEAQVMRAYELEPLANAAVLGFSLLCVGQTARAHATLQRTLDLYPASVQALWVIGLGHSLQGQHEESLAALGKAVALTGRSPLMLGELGASLAQAGRRDEAQAILEELQRKAAEAYVPPMSFARVYMYLGDMDALFTWLEQALVEHDVQAAWSVVWPGLDHVRADPRYQALLHKHGLESLLTRLPAS
jgi:serine/threonine-protein kinase